MQLRGTGFRIMRGIGKKGCIRGLEELRSFSFIWLEEDWRRYFKRKFVISELKYLRELAIPLHVFGRVN